MCRLLSLPDELLLHIINQAPKRDAETLASTSKRCYGLVYATKRMQSLFASRQNHRDMIRRFGPLPKTRARAGADSTCDPDIAFYYADYENFAWLEPSILRRWAEKSTSQDEVEDEEAAAPSNALATSHARLQQRLQGAMEEAQKHGLELPRMFVALMQSPALQLALGMGSNEFDTSIGGFDVCKGPGGCVLGLKQNTYWGKQLYLDGRGGHCVVDAGTKVSWAFGDSTYRLVATSIEQFWFKLFVFINLVGLPSRDESVKAQQRHLDAVYPEWRQDPWAR